MEHPDAGGPSTPLQLLGNLLQLVWMPGLGTCGGGGDPDCGWGLGAADRILDSQRWDWRLEFLFSEWTRTSLVSQIVKNLPAMQEMWVPSLGGEDPLEKGMPTHSGILAGRIQWTEEPGGLQSMGWQRVRHDWVTNTKWRQSWGLWAHESWERLRHLESCLQGWKETGVGSFHPGHLVVREEETGVGRQAGREKGQWAWALASGQRPAACLPPCSWVLREQEPGVVWSQGKASREICSVEGGEVLRTLPPCSGGPRGWGTWTSRSWGKRVWCWTSGSEGEGTWGWGSRVSAVEESGAQTSRLDTSSV